MRASSLVAGAAVVVVAGLLALMPAGSPPQPAQEQPAATLPVERADVVCPPMPAPGDPRAALTAPALGQEPTGMNNAKLENNPVQVRADGSTLGRIGARGEVWRRDGDPVAGGLRARAEGELAAGLVGVATSDIDAGGASGTATAACVGPASSWWFVGGGSSVGREDTLILSNASPTVAVVDLSFHGPEGPVEDVDSKQIAIEPGDQQEFPLADFVAGVGDVAVQVSVPQGRVAAALSETRTEPSVSSGVDFIGGAAAPATDVTVTGVPAGPGRRDLVVVNTGDSETVVDVEVLGATGGFQPTELDVLRVPAGAVVSQEVTDVTRDEVAGLRLSADQPVTAAVRSTTPDPADVAYAPAGDELTEGAAAAIPDGSEATVVLSSASQSPANARVRVYDPGGEQINEQDLEISAGQTVTWQVRGQGDPASFVVSSADGAQLTGAVHWSGDSGQSITALRSLHSTVTRPPLTYDPVGR